MGNLPGFIDYIQKLDKKYYKLPFYLGIDQNKSPVVLDFANAGSVLMLGSKGTGKTMFAHSTVCSLISSYSPEYIEIALIDLAEPEFTNYESLPHLASTPVYNSLEAISLLSSLSNTIGGKYQIIFIDTFSELVLNYGTILNNILKKLTSRKNTFVIMWDSKPYEEIFTPEIKKLFSSKILFSMDKNEEAIIIADRTITNMPKNKGEAMIFMKNNSEPVFVHCPYISNEDILKVVDFVK